jgi:hypothetical protein
MLYLNNLQNHPFGGQHASSWGMSIGNYVSEPGALSLLGATLLAASVLLRRAFKGGLGTVQQVIPGKADNSASQFLGGTGQSTGASHASVPVQSCTLESIFTKGPSV